MSEIIKRIQDNISAVGGCEAKALIDSESLSQIWQSRQLIIDEMNIAKQAAITKAAEPYLEKLDEVDKEYAMLLQMIGDNRIKDE